MSDQNKTVLITGASSGIGRETAYYFAKNKYNIIISYFDDLEQGQKTKNKCKELGAANVELIQLDLTSQQSIESLVNKISKIDILINNAGYLAHADLKDLEIADIERQFQTNLIGVVKLTKLLLPNITESIINIGSNLGWIPKGRMSVYVSSKFGLRGFTKSLAKELKSRKVYLVNPPATATNMGPASGVDPRKVAEMIFNVALGKYGTKTGTEINYIDYQYGAKLGKAISILRKIKNINKL